MTERPTLAHWSVGKPEVIVLATDWSARCDRPLDRAIQLAYYWNALLVVLTVVEQPVSEADWVDLEGRIKARIFEEMPSRNVRFHIDVTQGDVADQVMEVARAKQADLIVTGVAHRDHVGEFVLGTAVERLVRTSGIPILVVKCRPQRGYTRIMAATDYSVPSAYALGILPAFPRAEVTLVHARVPGWEYVFADDTADRPVSAEEIRARESFLRRIDPVTRERLQLLSIDGLPTDALAASVRARKFDLALIDRYGNSSVRRALIGSTAEKLLAALPCDVMIVPEPLQSTASDDKATTLCRSADSHDGRSAVQ